VHVAYDSCTKSLITNFRLFSANRRFQFFAVEWNAVCIAEMKHDPVFKTGVA